MSNLGRFVDRNPGQRSAGVGVSLPDDNASSCVKPKYQPPQTPPELKKYRRIHTGEAGAKIIHYGRAEDPLPPAAFVYGKKTHSSDHVPEVIKANKAVGMSEFVNKIAEDRYASNIREPLGQSIMRNYKFPPVVHDDQFKFGVPTRYNESAKNILFPEGGSLEDSERVRQMYLKSHGDTDAGEQFNRKYQWPVDPTAHRFGKADFKELGGVASSLRHDTAEAAYPKTRVVKKTVEDYRSTAHEELGRPRNLGTGKTNLGNDVVFGGTHRPTEMDWGAGMCIHGKPSDRELQPDKDLGRSLRHGFKNEVKPGDEGRIFGVPTIRDDIKKTALKSVADPYNYGDEPQVNQLLYPQAWLRKGLSREDFISPRSREEIRELFEAAGFPLKVSKTEAIYNQAASMSGGVVCLGSFIEAYNWFEGQGF
jgi:hypothetical protein